MFNRKEYMRQWHKRTYARRKKKVLDYNKQWRKQHPNYWKQHQANNRKAYRAASKRYRQSHPWKRIFYDINRRCYNKQNKCYKYYGARGIQNHLTESDIQYLWLRDGADFLVHPSIDRINHTESYTLQNCRFIELAMNGIRALHSRR